MLKRSHRDLDLPSLVPPQFLSVSEARRQAAAAEKLPSSERSNSGLKRQQSCKWDHALLSAYMVDAEMPRAPTAGLGMGLEIWEPEWKIGWESHSDYMKFLFGGGANTENINQSKGTTGGKNMEVDQDTKNPPEDSSGEGTNFVERVRKRPRLETGDTTNRIKPPTVIQDRTVRFCESTRVDETTEQHTYDEDTEEDGELDADAMELIQTDREIVVGAKRFAAKTTLRRGFFARALKRQLEDLREENSRLKRVACNYLDDHERIQLFSQLGSEHSILSFMNNQNISTDQLHDRDFVNAKHNALKEMNHLKEARNVLESIVATTNTVVANPTDVHRRDLTLVKVIQQAQRAFVITNPALPDNPIVWASDEFAQLTGYTREEVCGRNCRFLQGPRTNPKSVEAVRRAIEEKHEASIVLLNYRKDGSTFWNRFFIAPLKDSTGRVTFYVGVQTDVSHALHDDETCDGAAAWMQRATGGVQGGALHSSIHSGRVSRRGSGASLETLTH
uniref:LOV domain-containing protein n=1 Tax=Aureoumbra lagunensis TaxID=44058 RepID=A0A7S3K0H2_9STRA|mmetsp:Transcript_6032/g.8532  ORF Transcript_6032/g.8532 Transcript_6032/m.8532 type:complete len:504 (+) Transcript_6032:35-1546(+)